MLYKTINFCAYVVCYRQYLFSNHDIGFCDVVMHYVVQKDNYHEMEDIVMLGEKYNADRVWFSRIQDWNTWNNFKEYNIFDVQHPQHSDYRIQLDKLVKLNSKIVEEATLRQLH